MAFEWKWQPTPINLRPYDDRSKAASSAMQGYVPNDANIAVIGSPQAIAQSNMTGYVPSDEDVSPKPLPGISMSNVQPITTASGQQLGGEGGYERSAGGNYGRGMEYIQQQNIQALQEEYLRNAYRIAELEQKIANKKNEISAGIKSRNELDLQLAANRARIGDMGNSLAHQQAINTREYQQYLRDLEKSKEGQGKESQLERDVIDAYTELAWADNEKQQQVAQFKVDRALEAYKKATGKDYANPFAVDTGSAKPGQKANTLEKAWAKYTASFDKKGNPTQAAIDEWNKDKQGLPFSTELQEKDNQVSKATSQEKAKEDADKLAKKQQDAVDEIADNIDNYKLNKNNGSYTETAANGQSVTVTKNANGKSATVRCGKKSKVVDL